MATDGLTESFNICLDEGASGSGGRENEMNELSCGQVKTTTGECSGAASPNPATQGGNEVMADDHKPTNGKPLKVMVAVDCTQWSFFAFDWYLKNVYHSDHEVVCYHVMDKPAVHGDEFCVSVEAHDAVMRGCETNAQDLHNEFAKKMEIQKVNGRVVVQFSVIGYGESIVEAAVKEKVDMVVVGTRGKGLIRRTMTGSVSDYVLKHAHCPVIVCCQDRPRRRSSRLSSLSSQGSVSEDIN